MKQSNNTLTPNSFKRKEKTNNFFSPINASLLALYIFTYSSFIDAETIPNLAEQKIVVPEKISGVNTLSAEQVLGALISEQPPLLIDARIKQDREYGYIETSINLPDIETNCKTLSNIVSTDKNKAIIFYCNGVQCGRSVISIKIALSCGYRNLSWFRGGFAEWKEKGYQYLTHK